MKKSLSIVLLIFAVRLTAFADPQPEGDDPIGRSLFPPELVMKFQQDIGLDESQSTTIKNEIQKAQSKFLDLQWQLQSESQKMAQMLQGPSVDETKVLAQADKVMDLEREVKKTHLSLLIRIKNKLTEAQQTKLTELRTNPQK